MLRELQHLWPRSAGQGWEKAKTHEQLHVPDDIKRNGAVQNYHGGPTEHNHIFHVKHLTRATQRRKETLDQQIANWESESYVIDYAYQRMATGSASVFPFFQKMGNQCNPQKVYCMFSSMKMVAVLDLINPLLAILM
jgi:hypothetical protein